MLHFHSTERYGCVAIKCWPKPCHLSQLVMLFLVCANTEPGCDSTEPLKQELGVERPRPQKALVFPCGPLRNVSCCAPFRVFPAYTRVGLSVGRRNLWVASTPSSDPTAGSDWGAFLLGCLFYVSSDCLFRLKKKKIRVDIFLTPINSK